MASAYLLAHVQVTNAAQYEAYKALSLHAMQTYQAELCVRGGPVEVLEGDWAPERVVLLKFPSPEAARAFYDSPEYSLARLAREGAAEMRMVLIQGL